MFGKRWRLFRLFGIPLYVDASWLLILALLTWTITGNFRSRLEGLGTWQYWAMGLITALSFFLCIVLHEMGHALVARANGTPVRGITLFLFGGVAELGGEPPSAGQEFSMAIAGPAVSAVLAAGCFGVALLAQAAGWGLPVRLVFGDLAAINLGVLVFNLVPAFPLDGGRVLRSVLWGATGKLHRATYWASLLGQGFAWLLILWGIGEVFAGFLDSQAGFNLSGLWLVLIGLFLRGAAQGGYQQVLVRELLQGEPIRRFMNTEPIVVPPSLDLQRWVDDYVYRHHRKAFPVASNGHLEGVISTRELARYPRAEWGRHTVGELMRNDLAAVTIRPEADALEALQQMQRTGTSRLLVTDHDRLVGIVSLKDLLCFLDLKLNLERVEG
jgi:Zn-dependent protease/CBS domain-containing protein